MLPTNIFQVNNNTDSIKNAPIFRLFGCRFVKFSLHFDTMYLDLPKSIFFLVNTIKITWN